MNEELNGISGQVRALALLSGGLDSQLAVCVLREQGIDVHGVVFASPFFDSSAGRLAGANLSIPVKVVNFTSDILELLHDPPNGFGQNLNPCIDCHAAMLRRTGQIMREKDFDFIITGEVLGQRPKSQNYSALENVVRIAGVEGYVLRPLSARLLPVTEPERRGWVKRDELLDIQGRTRKRQLQLAEHYGLHDFPTPAGGCRLTEPNFCRRLKDLMEHEGLNGERSLQLLRFGRHFRLSPTVKVIVGRHEDDNVWLEGNAELYDLVIKTEGIPGPTGVLPITARDDEVLRAARICVRYSDAAGDKPVRVRISSPRGRRYMDVPAENPELVRDMMI